MQKKKEGEHKDKSQNTMGTNAIKNAFECKSERVRTRSVRVPVRMLLSDTADDCFIVNSSSFCSSRLPYPLFLLYFPPYCRCWSYVGRCSKAGQPISIGRGCETYGTILHELMHALGFFHTSSRPDRDAYVIVHTGNIWPGIVRRVSLVVMIPTKTSVKDVK